MKKSHKAGGKPVHRNRKKVNLTLSDAAREMGEEMAKRRGIKFSQLVEIMLRTELRKAGLLKPEGGEE